eukprot:TRINITY_DN431_c0_g1_i3.p1 TRINITY_DN431_c0_g1~~TRINITY_DN431_c0_g1_i3.p1  ORF type:complete len:912 (+),score=200.94 TRINITY_DN431_c0_g1_i3:92-2827(+)
MADGNRYRVKVYQLTDDGQWDDKGTGHINYFNSTDDTLVLSVKSEDTGENLIEHTVESDGDYERQGDTILTWCESDSGVDLALSFQEPLGFSEVWEQIMIAQGADPTGAEIECLDSDEAVALPIPDMSNLSDICRKIKTCTLPQKEILCAHVTRKGFVAKLYDLFQQAEDLEQRPVLQTLFEIFVGLFLLNDSSVFEIILGDENIMKTIACLEYDPDIPAHITDRQRHRSFLEKANFKQVVDFRDPSIVSKIHQNYRVSYIKDAILLRQLDDPTMSTLNSTVLYNNIFIISHLAEDEEFMRDLFSKMCDIPTEGSWEEKKHVYQFLQELCGLAKTLQLQSRGLFYKTLVEHSMFHVLELAMLASSPRTELWLWLAVADILTNLLQFDSSLLRGYLYSRIDDSTNMLTCILSVVATDEEIDTGLIHQFTEILRMVLDNLDSMVPSEKDHFITTFFGRHLIRLVEAVNRPTFSRWLSPAQQASKFHSCELLSFCFHEHGQVIKPYALRQQILEKVVGLISHQPPHPNHIVLSAIRFVRTVIDLQDDVYIMRVVQGRLLDPLMTTFSSNGSRYNLLNSSVIELLEFIRVKNIKPLVNYLATYHLDRFKDVTYVPTFKMLLQRHEQNLEYERDSMHMVQTSAGKNGVGPPLSARFVEADDDSYFSNIDDQDDVMSSSFPPRTRPASPPSSGVVAPSSPGSPSSPKSPSSPPSPLRHLVPGVPPMDLDAEFVERSSMAKVEDDESDLVRIVAQRKQNGVVHVATPTTNRRGRLLSQNHSHTMSHTQLPGSNNGAKKPASLLTKRTQLVDYEDDDADAELSLTPPSSSSPTPSSPLSPSSPVFPVSPSSPSSADQTSPHSDQPSPSSPPPSSPSSPRSPSSPSSPSGRINFQFSSNGNSNSPQDESPSKRRRLDSPS